MYGQRQLLNCSFPGFANLLRMLTQGMVSFYELRSILPVELLLFVISCCLGIGPDSRLFLAGIAARAKLTPRVQTAMTKAKGLQGNSAEQGQILWQKDIVGFPTERMNFAVHLPYRKVFRTWGRMNMATRRSFRT